MNPPNPSPLPNGTSCNVRLDDGRQIHGTVLASVPGGYQVEIIRNGKQVKGFAPAANVTPETVAP